MRVAIVNYGMGNLGSVRRALDDLGAKPFIAEHPIALFDANRIILPGVGAFSEGITRLREAGWEEVLHRMVAEENKPLLGICLGMQLLGSHGEEGGGLCGLGFVEGRIRRLDALGCTLRVPHVGWNSVQVTVAGDPLFARIPPHSDFYFVHSYAYDSAGAARAIAVTDYGVEVVAAVRKRHVFGTQFHPEKSSRVGRQLLRNFLDYVSC